jgi:hypothetical protein
VKKQSLSLIGFASLALITLGSACNSTPAAPGTCTNCSAITPENFVAALVSLAQSGQIPAAYASSTLAKTTSLQPGYFIIWDGKTQSYEAVNINTTPDIYGTTETSACAEHGATCSNLSPTAAAETFANATGENHSTTAAGGTGLVTVVNGTQFGGTFGQETFPDPYDGTMVYGNTGSLNYFPVAPTNSVSAPDGQQVYQDNYNDGILYSTGAQTKDVDLQRAQVQNTNLLQRAALLSSGLQMSLSSAVQLTQLADKIQRLQSSGTQLTSDDRSAIAQSLLGIAGITQDEINGAIQNGLQGDNSAAAALVDKVSQNVGVPSTTLRDQILPGLGVNLN